MYAEKDWLDVEYLLVNEQMRLLGTIQYRGGDFGGCAHVPDYLVVVGE
jgi:hypothetical protein